MTERLLRAIERKNFVSANDREILSDYVTKIDFFFIDSRT